jgi:hypothetical protein
MLSKGEARNVLARAVFFLRLGEIRDQAFENQRYRASGLNLAGAATEEAHRGGRPIGAKTYAKDGLFGAFSRFSTLI